MKVKIMNDDKIIVVNHVQQLNNEEIASRFQLGLYKYFNDKSLRHVLQHYLDVARSRYGDEQVEDVYYNEDAMKFCITYTSNVYVHKTCIMADVYPVHSVSALPIAPFKPRSPEEAALMN